MEASKKDKKTARQIIEKGLLAQFAKGLGDFELILANWKKQERDSRDTYLLLYENVINFDRQIATRYDRMSGSRYMYIIAEQLSDSLITEDDILELSEEARSFINGIRSI
jgi:hypothetical protein